MENYKYILIYCRGVLFTLNLYAQSHISKPLEYTFDIVHFFLIAGQCILHHIALVHVNFGKM